MAFEAAHTVAAMDLPNEFSRLQREFNGSLSASQQRLRERALETVVGRGIPTTGDEEWKYTNVARLGGAPFRRAPRVSVSSNQLRELALPQLMGSQLVFVNGYFDATLSTVSAVDGVSVAPLSQLRGAEELDVSAMSERIAGRFAESRSVFPALNAAFASDGVVIRIGKNQQLAHPIHLIHVAVVEEETARAVCPRHLIVLDENARATVVESFFSAGSHSALTVHHTQVELMAGAHCEHVKIQREQSTSEHISYLDAVLQRDAQLHQLNCSVGGGTVRNEIRPIIAGSGAECFLRGLTVLGDSQHVDNTTIIDHAEPQAQSTEIYKGVFGGKSSSAFSGTIVVRKDAQKTNAIQSNDSVLLSDQATINTRPQLKIWADDVKCTHGATVGQLREDALHYLRARGIPFAMARQMLIEAFTGEVVSSVTDQAIASWLGSLLATKLQEILPHS